MKKLLISLTLVLAMLVVLTSCAKQPTQEMNDSKAAIDAVIADGGEKYAKDEVKTLNDELTAANGNAFLVERIERLLAFVPHIDQPGLAQDGEMV